MAFHRCPSAVIGADAPWIDDFLDAWVSQTNGDGWPARGPREEQAAWYVTAKAIADAEKARLDRAEQEALQTLYGAGGGPTPAPGR